MIKSTTKENTVKNLGDMSPAPRVGSLVKGKVAARDRSALFIDLGIHGTGIIYGKEFYQARETIKNLNLGDMVSAKVIEVENEDGYHELSLQDATKEINWQNLREMKQKEETITVKIAGVNKGGLLTNIHNIPAFLPVSQLSPENYPRVEDADKQKILKELQKFIGKTMEVKVLDISPEENKLILSEKAKGDQATKKVLEMLKKGDTVEGVITGIADFGAFMKFSVPSSSSQSNLSENALDESVLTSPATAGLLQEQKIEKSKPSEIEVEGLIHISELDWQLVQNPSEVVTIGQVLKAQVIDIKNNQIFLSLKRLKHNPWEEVEKMYKKGDRVKGEVISFNSFGAFVQVLPKIRGLCHISEFNSQEDMEQHLKLGNTYEFEILLVDPKEHRLSLKPMKSE